MFVWFSGATIIPTYPLHAKAAIVAMRDGESDSLPGLPDGAIRVNGREQASRLLEQVDPGMSPTRSVDRRGDPARLEVPRRREYP